MALLRDEDVLDLLALLRPALEAVPQLARRPSVKRLIVAAAGAYLAHHYAAVGAPPLRDAHAEAPPPDLGIAL